MDIAVALRGKYRPDYEKSVENNRDICIVVNGETTKVTGRKRDQIKFRHHTGENLMLMIKDILAA